LGPGLVTKTISFVVLAPGWNKGAMTFRIATFSKMPLYIKGLFVTLSITIFRINDTQHNSTSTIMLIVFRLNVAFCLSLC
jgi:hypothetical protein